MVFHLDKWRLEPIKGATGQTYMGIRGTERVFIKRNTSPLLAALSKEGIAPKLVWTKRTVDGDILTAQKWLDGSQLKEDEIGQRNDVIDVLYQLHHSISLKNMIEKIGGQIHTPEMLLKKYDEKLPKKLNNQPFLTEVYQELKNHLPTCSTKNYMVVHGDVNHRNWLVSNNYLYLVDWDSVMLADPGVDLGMFLGHYVPQENWSKWLLSYGIQAEEDVLTKIYWYAVFSFLQEILRHYEAGETSAMDEEISKLKAIVAYQKKFRK